jgi:hypothetical protein
MAQYPPHPKLVYVAVPGRIAQIKWRQRSKSSSYRYHDRTNLTVQRNLNIGIWPDRGQSCRHPFERAFFRAVILCKPRGSVTGSGHSQQHEQYVWLLHLLLFRQTRLRPCRYKTLSVVGRAIVRVPSGAPDKTSSTYTSESVSTVSKCPGLGVNARKELATFPQTIAAENCTNFSNDGTPATSNSIETVPPEHGFRMAFPLRPPSPI